MGAFIDDSIWTVLQAVARNLAGTLDEEARLPATMTSFKITI
jgi:hypothetical protein